MYKFLGKKMKTPIIIGSGPASFDNESILKLSRAGAGAVVTKTIRKEKAINPVPHMLKNSNNSLINNEKWTDFSPEQWIDKELPKLKDKDVIVIASVGHTLEESKNLVEKLEKAGASMIELVSYDYRDLIPMVEDAKKRIKIPVIVKLSPLTENIGEFARKLEKAGADCITACDSVGPSLRINIDTGKPLLGGDGLGWLTGSAIKPIILHKIHEIRKNVEIPIIGLGGCMTGADGIEMIMAGADYIGICTAPIMYGEKVIEKIYNDFKNTLSRLGYSSINEAKGIIEKNIEGNRTELNFIWNKETCIHCKLCENVCCYNARKIDKDMILNKDKCRFCGLCVSTCPVKSLKAKEM